MTVRWRCEGGEIVAVGPRSEIEAEFEAVERIDAGGRVVLPGLVNAHTHLPMVLFRGIADDLELMDWLENHIFPAEAEFVDEQFVRWGTRLACVELLMGGVTTVVDMYYFEDAIAEEAEACGIRAVLGQTLIDFPAPDNESWEAMVAATRRFVERWRGHERIVAAVAPHAPYTVSDAHLREAHALAAELGTPLLIHLAEDRKEIESVTARTGTSSVRWLDRLGVLDDRMLAAHMVWPDGEEIALLAERGVGVAHCPQSNMKIAAGVAPVPALLEAGVAVGLGTDGAASNNDLELWDEIDTAAKLHKVTTGDPTVVDAYEALHMATLGGAQAIDLDERIGSLEPGKRADLIVVTTDAPHQEPWFDPYSLLSYSTGAADVETVIVDGRIVVRDRRVLTVDRDAALERARSYRDAIAAFPAPPSEP